MQHGVFSRQLKGFTLIELLIVLAIVGILVTIALPSYQHYLTRTKFSEVVLAVAPYKLAVETCTQTLGGFALDSQNNCGTPTQNGIPNDFTAATPEKGYVAHINVAYQDPDIIINATSQRLPTNYDYRLIGSYQENGQIHWTIDPNCSCKINNVC